jgi:hypothetical protein
VLGLPQIAVGTSKDDIRFIGGSAAAEGCPVVKMERLPLIVIGSPVVIGTALRTVANSGHYPPTINTGLVPLQDSLSHFPFDISL